TGLARHREDRYQSAGEFYQALMDFCFQHSIKVSGSDLSNLMRRLFAREIEEEKSLRRSEPGGMAAQRPFDDSAPRGVAASASEVESTPEQKSDKSELMAMGDTAAAVRDPQNTGRTPAGGLGGQVARTRERSEPEGDEGGDRRYRYRD